MALPPELMARVRQIQIRVQRLVSGTLQGSYRSNFRGTGIEFEEVRPYQPGDEVRSIDWNVTARTGAPHIKTYVEERQLILQLVCDTSLSLDFASKAKTKREVAAEVAALFALVAESQQDQVGLCLFSDRPGLYLPPKKESHHVQRVVREVMATRSGGVGSSLGAVLEDQLKRLKRGSFVLVVSDFLGLDGDEWEDPMARLARRHDVICVRVFDPFEEELPRAGILPFCDLESGEMVEIDTGSRRVRETWRRKAMERKDKLRDALRRSRCDLIEIATDGDVATPIIACFQRRSRGGAATAGRR
jgi:uncharacterized protein (DUF58 family)